MTILRYGLTTDPFPLQASPDTGDLVKATLTVVASNPNPDPDNHPVTLQYLSIVIPTGQDPTDLTADDKLDSVPPAGWNPPDKVSSSGKVRYVFHPIAGGGQVKGAGLNFILKSVPLNRQTGTVEIDVIEGSGGDPTQQFFLTKFPDTWGEVLFWADPPVVEPGNGPTLHWAGPPLAAYGITYYTPQDDTIHKVPKRGDPPLANQGLYPAPNEPALQLTRDTTFYLTAERTVNQQTYSAQRQVTATVQMPPPKIISFQETPTAFGSPNTVVTLAWQTANVAELRIKDVGTFTGADAAQGSVQVTRNAQTLFQAEADGGTAYIGAPATAQLCFGELVSTALNVTPNSQQTLPLSVGGRPIFDLNLLQSWTIFQNGKASARIWLTLKPGVEVADLGTLGPAARVEDLNNATYSGSLPQSDLYLYSIDLNGDGTPNRSFPLAVGATLAVKLTDNTQVLLWYSGITMDDSTGVGSMSFVWFQF